MRRLTRRQQLAAAVLAVLALLFLSLDFAGGELAGARGGTTGALGSLYRGTDAVLGPVRRFVQGVPDVAGNRREIARLTQRNADLQRQLQAAAADAATARQLRTLQLQADTADWRLMPARVIATGPGAGFQWSVTVDVGGREHGAAGQTVTDGLGLVGRVVAVHATTSVVLLAADPTSGVGVRDTRSGALLLATGGGSGPLTAAALGDAADVRVGDRLVTGPAGKTTYAAGVAVGVVTSVHTAADGSVSARLRPVSRQVGLDLVGIVLSEPRGTARPALEPGQRVTGTRIAAAVAGMLSALLLQASLLGPLTFPVPVSLPALLVIVVGIYAGPGVGMALGFATGLLADLGSDHPAGAQALCWLAAGLVAGMLGGLPLQRGYGTRGVAALAAVLGAATSGVLGLLLAILGSHAATVVLALTYLIPVGLTDALLGLAVVPVVRALLRAQGVRPPRPAARLIGSTDRLIGSADALG